MKKLTILLLLIFSLLVVSCAYTKEVISKQGNKKDYENSFSIAKVQENKIELEKYNNPESKDKPSENFITANPLDLSQIDRISKFRSCVGHDYSGLNSDGERETLRSMKHYIEPLSTQSNAIKVFAPFDGEIREVNAESRGSQVFISPNAARKWNMVFFHINLIPRIEEGTSVQAGQLLGYGALDNSPNFDIALKKFSIKVQIFESPFLHMTNQILEEYTTKGITLENIIISKKERDADSCPVGGTMNGDAEFTSHSEQDFVKLKG